MLDASELSDIRRDARQSQLIARCLIVLLPIAGLAGLMGLASFEDKSLRGWAFFGVIVAFVVLALGVLVVIERRKRARGLIQDLQKGRMLLFEGELTFDIEDLTQAKLIEAKLLLNDEEKQSIEVLEASDRVYRVNGSPLRGWLKARVVDVALPPSDQEAYPRPIEEFELDMREEVARRTLSEEEKAELRGHYRRTMARLIPAGFILLYFITLAFIRAGIPEAQQPPPSYYALGGLAALSLFAIATTLTGASAMRRDIVAGIVVMLDIDAGHEEASERHKVSVETLPLSGKVWSIDGHPAQWRWRAAREKREAQGTKH